MAISTTFTVSYITSVTLFAAPAAAANLDAGAVYDVISAAASS